MLFFIGCMKSVSLKATNMLRARCAATHVLDGGSSRKITDASKGVMLHLVPCMTWMCDISFSLCLIHLSGFTLKLTSHAIIPVVSCLGSYTAFLQDIEERNHLADNFIQSDLIQLLH